MADVEGIRFRVDVDQARLGTELSSVERKLQETGRVAEAAAARINSGFGKSSAQVQDFGRAATVQSRAASIAFAGLGSAVAGLAAAFTVQRVFSEFLDFLRSSIHEALAAEDAINSLRASVEGAGADWKRASEPLKEYLGALQRTSRFSDEQLAAAFTRLTTITGNAATAIKALGPIVDTAAARSRPLEAVTEQIALAMQGNFRALKQLIPGLDEHTQRLLLQGTAAERASIIIEKLSVNQNRALESTRSYAGQIDVFNNQWSDLKEQVGLAALALTNAAIPLSSISSALREVNKELASGVFDWSRWTQAMLAWAGPGTLVQRASGALKALAADEEDVASKAQAAADSFGNVGPNLQDMLDALSQQAGVKLFSEQIDILRGRLNALNELRLHGEITAAQFDEARRAAEAEIRTLQEGTPVIERTAIQISDLTFQQRRLELAMRAGNVPAAESIDKWNQLADSIRNVKNQVVTFEAPQLGLVEPVRKRFADLFGFEDIEITPLDAQQLDDAFITPFLEAQDRLTATTDAMFKNLGISVAPLSVALRIAEQQEEALGDAFARNEITATQYAEALERIRKELKDLGVDSKGAARSFTLTLKAATSAVDETGVVMGALETAADAAAGAISAALSGGGSIKEALNQAMQAIAIESAVRAVFETALGLAASALGLAAVAEQHFQSAATFAIAAGMAGAIAGGTGGFGGRGVGTPGAGRSGGGPGGGGRSREYGGTREFNVGLGGPASGETYHNQVVITAMDGSSVERVLRSRKAQRQLEKNLMRKRRIGREE